MRDIASCFSENSINVSNSSCSNPSTTSYTSPNLTPCIQTSITRRYNYILSTNKQIFITVNWSKNPTNQGLTIIFGNDTSTSFKHNTNSKLFRKKKGNKKIEYDSEPDSLKIEVFWDFCNAQYDTGPEPVDGFYVVIMVDDEIGLILGEESMANRLKIKNPVGKLSLISRQEHFSGNTVYSTKAKFCETGISHDVLIRCSGENEGVKHHPILSVYIDKKAVIRVKRLHLNFRGNQTIFVDGLLVDLMWDLYNWFFNSSGYAVFMFRTRSGLDSRIWLEEKLLQTHDHQNKLEFSLLIYAYKQI